MSETILIRVYDDPDGGGEKSLDEAVIMARPGLEETENSYRYRVRDPGDFQKGSFRTIELKKSKPRVNAVIGRLKGESTTTIQSLLFPKEDGWSAASAGKWAREHRRGVDEALSVLFD
jgi:hypothetical protein